MADVYKRQTFALSKYADDPCECFGLKGSTSFTAQEKEMEIKMQDVYKRQMYSSDYLNS